MKGLTEEAVLKESMVAQLRSTGRGQVIERNVQAFTRASMLCPRAATVPRCSLRFIELVSGLALATSPIAKPAKLEARQRQPCGQGMHSRCFLSAAKRSVAIPRHRLTKFTMFLYVKHGVAS